VDTVATLLATTTADQPPPTPSPSPSPRPVHHSKVLLHPHLLHFLETEELVRVSSLCRDYSRIIKADATVGYWPAMCASLTGSRGIYSPHVTKNAKAYFFDELWKSRSKWSLDATAQDFKIRVSGRFRPGEKSRSKFALPLHQFLRVRRQQKAAAGGQGQGQGAVFVGESVPQHMLDGLLGGMMQQPVRLADSGRVLDRSVAVTCVLRGGKDPFTGSRLSMDCLTALPGLAAEIAAFKARQANVDISVGEREAMGLVEQVDPLLLEALVEAEQVSYAMLCCAMLCYAMLCYAVLCCVVLCYAVLCCAVLCCAMLCYVVLCYVMLFYDMLYYAMLCYAVLCCVVLCYVVLCCAMLCYAVLCCAMLCYAMLCYVMLCCAMLCYAVLCYAMLYCAMI
jgi:hypothetical protein